MYYKIVNADCDVYKKLHAMRTQELSWEDENKKAIEDKTGMTWDVSFGHRGQQTFNRVSNYIGFEFKEKEKISSNIWKQHSEHESIYVPNKRTKAGKEMAEFLRTLKGHWFGVVFDCLGVDDQLGKFCFPYVEICGDVLVLFLDDKYENKDANVIEITSVEAKQLLSVK